MSVISPVLAWLGKVPKWVWFALFSIAIILGAYYKGRSDENARWLAKMQAAEIQAQKDGLKARNAADAETREQAEEFEAQQEVLREVITDAENTGTNPLDALLDSL